MAPQPRVASGPLAAQTLFSGGHGLRQEASPLPSQFPPNCTRITYGGGGATRPTPAHQHPLLWKAPPPQWQPACSPACSAQHPPERRVSGRRGAAHKTTLTSDTKCKRRGSQEQPRLQQFAGSTQIPHELLHPQFHLQERRVRLNIRMARAQGQGTEGRVQEGCRPGTSSRLLRAARAALSSLQPRWTPPPSPRGAGLSHGIQLLLGAPGSTPPLPSADLRSQPRWKRS